MATTLEPDVVACPACGAKNRIDPRRAAERQPVCGKCGAKLPDASSQAATPSHPIEVTDANFEQVLAQAGDRPLLIDCWAEWCPPCRALGPTIDALARESNGRYVIGKLDTDRNQMTAGRFRIQSIPTMLIFKGGQLVDQLVGAQPKQVIEAKLSRHV